MDDPVLMTEVKRLAGIGDHFQSPPLGHGPVGVHDVAQRDPVDILHHDVGQRSAGRHGLPGVIHGDNRGVVECGGVLRLAAEAQVEAGIAGQICAQHLDRDIAMESEIAGQMYLGHSAEAQDLTQFVAVGEVLR